MHATTTINGHTMIHAAAHEYHQLMTALKIAIEEIDARAIDWAQYGNEINDPQEAAEAWTRTADLDDLNRKLKQLETEIRDGHTRWIEKR